MHCINIPFQDAVKIMAKDLVRTRRYVKKFIMMRANIQAVSLKVQVRFHLSCWFVFNGPYTCIPLNQKSSVL